MVLIGWTAQQSVQIPTSVESVFNIIVGVLVGN